MIKPLQSQRASLQSSQKVILKDFFDNTSSEGEGDNEEDDSENQKIQNITAQENSLLPHQLPSPKNRAEFSPTPHLHLRQNRTRISLTKEFPILQAKESEERRDLLPSPKSFISYTSPMQNLDLSKNRFNISYLDENKKIELLPSISQRLQLSNLIENQKAEKGQYISQTKSLLVTECEASEILKTVEKMYSLEIPVNFLGLTFVAALILIYHIALDQYTKSEGTSSSFPLLKTFLVVSLLIISAIGVAAIRLRGMRISDVKATWVIILSLSFGFLLVLLASYNVNSQNVSISVSLGIFANHLLIVLHKISTARLTRKQTLAIIIMLISISIVGSGLQMIVQMMQETDKVDDKQIEYKIIITSISFELIIAILLLIQYIPIRMFGWSPLVFCDEERLRQSIKRGCVMETIENDAMKQIGMKVILRQINLNGINAENILLSGQLKNLDKKMREVRLTISKELNPVFAGRQSKLSNRNIVSEKDRKKDRNNESSGYLEMNGTAVQDAGLSQKENKQQGNSKEEDEYEKAAQRRKRNDIKKMYQDILNLIPEGVALISSENKLVYANKTLSKILSCQKNQITNILLNLATKQQATQTPAAATASVITAVIAAQETNGTLHKHQQSTADPKSVSQSTILGNHMFNSVDAPRRQYSLSKPSIFNRVHRLSTLDRDDQQQNNISSGSRSNIPYPLGSDRKHSDAWQQHRDKNLNFEGGDNLISDGLLLEEDSKARSMQMTYEKPILANGGGGVGVPSKKTNDYSDVMSFTRYLHPHQHNHDNAAAKSDYESTMRTNVADEIHLVRKQQSKKFKNSELLRKDVNVRDILTSIFENLKVDQDTRTAKTFELRKSNSSDFTSDHSLQPPPPDPTKSKFSYTKQQSFFSQQKDNLNIGYFQYIDDKIKVEVEYDNRTLVLSMVMCEIVANGFVEQLALILVDPLWQEMYEKRIDEMNAYRMKMFASLSHELRTPLNCSILMLQQLKTMLKEEGEEDEPREGSLQRSNQASPNPGPETIKQRIQKALRSIKRSDSLRVDDSFQKKKAVMSKERVEHYILEYIDPALNSSSLLLNQINDILDFVQIDSGKFKFTFVQFDLEKLLSSCMTLVGIQSKQTNRNVELVLKYDDKCPKIINSDPNRIRQIVLNFLSNAFKFTPNGQISLTASIVNPKKSYLQNQLPYNADWHLSEMNSMLDDEPPNIFSSHPNAVIQIAVEDQGIGISKEDIHKIFTIFNKIDLGPNQALNSQGCGLGLTISHSIAKGLGPKNFGGIQVKSEKGQGSVFSIFVEDRDEDLLEHQVYQKEETMKKMATINSLVDSPMSQFSRLKNGGSSFIAIDNLRQSQQQVLSHFPSCTQSVIAKMEEGQQSIRPKKHSNFTIKTSKTNKTIKKLDLASSGLVQKCQSSFQIDNSSCCIDAETEFNMHTILHFQPAYGYLAQSENGVAKEINSCISSSLFGCGVASFPSQHVLAASYIPHQNEDTLNQSQRSNHTNISTNKLPLHQSLSIQSKSYKTKTLKLINNEKKDDHTDALMSYNSARTNRRASSVQTTPQAFSMASSIGQISSYNASNSARKTQKDRKQSKHLIKKLQDDEKQTLEKSLLNESPIKILGDTTQSNSQPTYPQDEPCNCAQILVVDDNHFNMHALTMQLKTYGFTIDQAYNGQEAIQKVTNRLTSCESCGHTYKLIFMDIEMPIKNGYEATSEIRCVLSEYMISNIYKCSDFRKFPIIIACTAYVSDEDKKKALDHGMDDFIKKPVFKEGLDTLLEDWFDILFKEEPL